MSFSGTWPKWGSMRSGACSPRRPWVPRTAASASSSWPTPDANAMNDGETPSTWLHRAATLKAKHGNGNGAGMPLAIAAQMWPTPTVSDSSNTANATAMRSNPDSASPATFNRNARPLNEQAEMLWATPRATDGEKGGPNQRGRKGDAMLPSPATAASRSGPQDQATVRGGLLVLSDGRGLNPRFVEWLMGWPIGWTSFDFAATEWSRFKRRWRSEFSRIASASGLISNDEEAT